MTRVTISNVIITRVAISNLTVAVIVAKFDIESYFGRVVAMIMTTIDAAVMATLTIEAVALMNLPT